MKPTSPLSALALVLAVAGCPLPTAESLRATVNSTLTVTGAGAGDRLLLHVDGSQQGALDVLDTDPLVFELTLDPGAHRGIVEAHRASSRLCVPFTLEIDDDEPEHASVDLRLAPPCAIEGDAGMGDGGPRDGGDGPRDGGVSPADAGPALVDGGGDGGDDDDEDGGRDDEDSGVEADGGDDDDDDDDGGGGQDGGGGDADGGGDDEDGGDGEDAGATPERRLEWFKEVIDNDGSCTEPCQMRTEVYAPDLVVVRPATGAQQQGQVSDEVFESLAVVALSPDADALFGGQDAACPVASPPPGPIVELRRRTTTDVDPLSYIDELVDVTGCEGGTAEQLRAYIELMRDLAIVDGGA